MVYVNAEARMSLPALEPSIAGYLLDHHRAAQSRQAIACYWSKDPGIQGDSEEGLQCYISLPSPSLWTMHRRLI